MRIPQPEGTRGSLKWIQRTIEFRPDLLQPQAVPEIDWLSPLRGDDFAEYRDGSFLSVTKLDHLKPALAGFWPRLGPQWDALGSAGSEVPVLVEAKAHLDEFFSPPTGAKGKSLEQIVSSLAETSAAVQAKPKALWHQVFFQYTNRLAHLYFMHRQGIRAHLIFVSFIGDREMCGPETAGEWQAAFRTADAALGLPRRHRLSRYIHHVFPDVDRI